MPVRCSSELWRPLVSNDFKMLKVSVFCRLARSILGRTESFLAASYGRFEGTLIPTWTLCNRVMEIRRIIRYLAVKDLGKWNGNGLEGLQSFLHKNEEAQEARGFEALWLAVGTDGR